MPLPNVQDLTQKLATMSDQQMQQYAKMHQEDPYVLALAVSEKNQRAAMRAGAQPQAAQPSVAEAEIAGMAAPPQAGLSALPAQNLESMDTVQAAGGGVLGFQQGGLYEIPGMVTGDPRLQELLQERETTEAPEQMRLLPAFWEALKSGKTVAEVRGEPPAEAPATAPTPAPQAPQGGLRDIAAKMGQGIDNFQASPAELQPAPQRAVAPATPTASTPPPTATPTTPGEKVAEKPAVPETTVADRARAALKPGLDAGQELIRRDKELTDQEIADAKEQLARFDANAKGQPLVASEREKRLRQQEDALFGESGQALGNAAMRGFLAILGGTNRKRRINIARGLAVGLNSFDQRMAQVDQRRAEINKNLDQIETLREQAASASAEKRAALEARMNSVRTNGARASLNLFKAIGYDTDMDIGLESFKAAEAERVADKKLAHDSAEKALDRKHDMAVAGVRAAASGGGRAPKEFDLQSAYSKYLQTYEEAAAKSPLPPAQPRMSIQQYAQAMGILPVVSTAPGPGAVVLPRK